MYNGRASSITTSETSRSSQEFAPDRAKMDSDVPKDTTAELAKSGLFTDTTYQDVIGNLVELRDTKKVEELWLSLKLIHDY